MIDERLKRWAATLLEYSLELRKGQLFMIVAEPVSASLVYEVYREALRRGAHPYTNIILPELAEIFLKNASDRQLRYTSPVMWTEIKSIDAVLHIRGGENTKSLSNVDPKAQARMQAARLPLRKIYSRRDTQGKLRWCLTQYPTYASAQDAHMSLAEYEDFVLKACFLDKRDPVAAWRKLSKDQERIVRFLNRVDRIRVEALDTDLTLRVKGRRWVNSDGHKNFPSGEVFTSPLERSAEGRVRYTYPAVYTGREVEDVRLEFKKGKVVKYSAARGEDFLGQMIKMDKGSCYLGEFAIGTNYGIKKATCNILFDEKIGGSFHMALGNSYGETGGKNVSSLHWDMICDLKKGGRITADGKVFYENGKFLI
jgi:aminopeptidase